jgi:hypothetical protein
MEKKQLWKRGTRAIQIRVTGEELRSLDAACKDVGMKRASYVRLVLLRDLKEVFPKDQAGVDRFIDQVAEIAGQVVKHLGRSEGIRYSARKKGR